ncbi:MAG: mechanosensitive ion channel [Roseiflexaceae bacterium]|nr:mechanosensitive ion channel [Roseiflexaceae bacterium]
MDIQIVIDSLTKIFRDILNFIPNLVNGLIILIVGFLLARVIRWVLSVVLKRLKFDPLVERSGITGTLRGLGVQAAPSQIFAQTIFAFLLLSFLITSTDLMGLGAVSRLLQHLLDFLPNIIAAVILFLLGGVVAQFIGGIVTTAAAASGLSYATRAGRFVQHLLSIFVVILALGQLGIDTAILVTALTILIAAFGLALSLAFGLGARGIVTHILAGFYMRQRLPAGQAIEMGVVSGKVSSVGGVNTLVTTPDGDVVVPNALLLDSVVRSPAQPPTP